MKKFIIVLIGTMAQLLTPLVSAADETEWLVAPYVWLSDITLGQSMSGPLLGFLFRF